MIEESGNQLGSLAQSARTKELKTARGLLFFIGGLTLLANIVFAGMAKSMVDEEVEKQLADLSRQGMVADPGAVEEFRTTAYRATLLINGIAAAIGLLFIVFGFFVYQKPVPITIASLVIYIGCIAAFALLDPATLASGIIIKIFVIAGLFKAVQAALASEKEKSALSPLSSPEMA